MTGEIRDCFASKGGRGPAQILGALSFGLVSPPAVVKVHTGPALRQPARAAATRQR